MEAATSRQTPAPTQTADASANQSSNSPLSPKTKYCVICTTLGKLCPNEFPGSWDWHKDSEEEEGNDQDKGEDNFSVCLDWDADLKKQDIKNQEVKDQKNIEGKTSQNSPTSMSATISTLQPPESSFKQSTKRTSETSTEEENKHNTLAIILGHES